MSKREAEYLKTGVVLYREACEQVDRIAAEQHRSRSGQLRVIVEDWLAAEAKKRSGRRGRR
jgi:hypothetical protein